MLTRTAIGVLLIVALMCGLAEAGTRLSGAGGAGTNGQNYTASPASGGGGNFRVTDQTNGTQLMKWHTGDWYYWDPVSDKYISMADPSGAIEFDVPAPGSYTQTQGGVPTATGTYAPASP